MIELVSYFPEKFLTIEPTDLTKYHINKADFNMIDATEQDYELGAHQMALTSVQKVIFIKSYVDQSCVFLEDVNPSSIKETFLRSLKLMVSLAGHLDKKVYVVAYSPKDIILSIKDESAELTYILKDKNLKVLSAGNLAFQVISLPDLMNLLKEGEGKTLAELIHNVISRQIK